MPDTSTSNTSLRLGYHDRANFAHLLYPLEAGWVSPPSPWKLETVHDSPAAVLEGLLAGDLDAAFITPAGAQTNGNKLAPLGGWGLAIAGATETALLLSPRRIDLLDGGDVALTPSSAQSTAEHVFRTLLTPYYGIALNLRHPDSESYNLKGPRLLLGDSATQEGERAKAEGWTVEDLGLSWWILTGLPMVWEILCYRRDLETEKAGAPAALQDVIRLSHRTADEQSATVLDVASSRLGLSHARVKELFVRQRYTLGPDEQKGLALFLDMASRAKAI